jgi:DNA-binding GntR family transcriptional regulator
MRRSIHPVAGRSGSDASARPYLVPDSPRGLGVRQRVKLVLHRAIVSGTIPGGTRLVEESIAREFAADPRQVRDAICELAAEGLVRMDGTGEAVVHELCRSDLEDIYQVRMLLEPLAAARAASLASQDDIVRAVKVLAAMEAETDAGRWADYNSSFHRVIDESGSSPRLVAILENLREASACYVRHSILAGPDRADQANAEHEEIIRAVIARDPAAAADATFRHLDGTLSALNVRRLGADPGAHVRGL